MERKFFITEMPALPKHSPSATSQTESTLEDDTNGLHFSRNRIIKNFLVVSLAWWIFFSVYDCLQMLQSTLNSEEGIGVISIAVQYGGGVFVSLLFPKYCIKKLGCKMMIILSIVLHVPYIAANFYPHWIVMILSSIFVSAGNPLIWSALCAYLNDISILYTARIQHNSAVTENNHIGNGDKYTYKLDDYSCYSNQKQDAFKDSLNCQKLEVMTNMKDNSVADIAVPEPNIPVKNRSRESILNYRSSTVLDGITARFFGMHGMIYHSCHIIGNIVTYYIFKVDAEETYVTNSTCSCGADFCNHHIGCLEGNLQAPSNEVRYALTGVCLAFAVVSVIITALFLDELKEKEDNVSLSLDNLMASCRLLKNLNFVFLIPMTLYIGVLHGFVMGDYTQAFIGCAWGIRNIALVLAVFGVTLALSSSICGWLVKYLGRLPIFLFTAVLNDITAVLLLCWQPDGEKPTMLFVVGGLLGFVIGTYWSQSRALYGVVFKEDQEAAFGSYQIWFCAGAASSYGYSKYLCTSIKIYLILIVSTLAILGYLVVEISYSKNKRRHK